MFWGLKPDPSIVVLMNGPMYHSAPAAYGMASARLGLHMVLQPRFEAEDMLRLIATHGITHMHIVPTMFVRLLRLPSGSPRALRRLFAAVRQSRCRAVRAGREASDDRMVGPGHQRILRRDRDRRRGLARVGRGAAQARHGRPNGARRNPAHR